MTLVVDASLLAAALLDSGADGRWAEQMLGADHLAAPHLLDVEVVSILRSAERAGTISGDVASMALADLHDLPIERFPFEPFASRVWELRDNLTSYDAWYVALAESLGVALATLDRRLSRAPGTTCPFELPPDPVD